MNALRESSVLEKAIRCKQQLCCNFHSALVYFHTCSHHRSLLMIFLGTHEDERTVLYKTKSLDGTKPDRFWAEQEVFYNYKANITGNKGVNL